MFNRQTMIEEIERTVAAAPSHRLYREAASKLEVLHQQRAAVQAEIGVLLEQLKANTPGDRAQELLKTGKILPESLGAAELRAARERLSVLDEAIKITLRRMGELQFALSREVARGLSHVRQRQVERMAKVIEEVRAAVAEEACFRELARKSVTLEGFSDIGFAPFAACVELADVWRSGMRALGFTA